MVFWIGPAQDQRHAPRQLAIVEGNRLDPDRLVAAFMDELIGLPEPLLAELDRHGYVRLGHAELNAA